MCFHSFYKKRSKKHRDHKVSRCQWNWVLKYLSFNQENGLWFSRTGRLTSIALAQLRPLFARSGKNNQWNGQNPWLTPRFMCSKIASPPWSNNRSKKTAPTMMVMAKVDVLLKSKWYTDLVSDILAGECALRRTGCGCKTTSSMCNSARKLSRQRHRSQNRGTFDFFVFCAWFNSWSEVYLIFFYWL